MTGWSLGTKASEISFCSDPHTRTRTIHPPQNRTLNGGHLRPALGISALLRDGVAEDEGVEARGALDGALDHLAIFFLAALLLPVQIGAEGVEGGETELLLLLGRQHGGGEGLGEEVSAPAAELEGGITANNTEDAGDDLGIDGGGGEDDVAGLVELEKDGGGTLGHDEGSCLPVLRRKLYLYQGGLLHRRLLRLNDGGSEGVVQCADVTTQCATAFA
ncbi:hypothetical protein KC322_g89 [Hortaea werneckii]|nr:hypothetical protein KC322_g89 [Hortaea werneckii]